MNYPANAILALAVQCAPNVAPPTVAAIVMTESRGRPFALNVNGGPRVGPQNSAAAATAIARRFVAAGYSVDLGLGQINSRNMGKLGLTWGNVFDPCINIAALGRVLTDNYEAALNGREPQAALRVAFSLYNTGSSSRGFRNGYVRKVVGNAGAADGYAVATPLNATKDARLLIVGENASVVTAEVDRPNTPRSWNLFERAPLARQAPLPLPLIEDRNKSVWME